MQNPFTIKEAIAFGWKKTLENVWFLVLFTLCAFIVQGILGNNSNGAGSYAVLFRLANILVNYFVAFTSIKLGLAIYKGIKPTTKMVFDVDWKLFVLYAIAALLTMLATGIGFILLIVPGIILAVRLGFTSFAVIEEGLKPIPALKRSWELTRGRFWPLLGLSAIICLIVILGAVLVVVGLLLALPVTGLALVYAYEKLKAAPFVAASTPAPVN